jgi:hypothetical protein
MSIPTPRSILNVNRRLDRQRRAADRHRRRVVLALAAMRGGALLTTVGSTTCWLNGQKLPRDVAISLVAEPAIEGLGDGLLPGFSQTYRSKWAARG